jgi:hypothetical protein
MRRHHDPELWNDDVEFLIQEADSALGLHGASLEWGGTIPAEELVERKIAAVFRANGGRLGDVRANGAVQRYRRAIRIWRLVPGLDQVVLVVYYSTTSQLPHGAAALLGNMALVTLWMDGGDEKLQRGLRLNRREETEPFRRRAERMVRAAHKAWQAAARADAEKWSEDRDGTKRAG